MRITVRRFWRYQNDVHVVFLQDFSELRRVFRISVYNEVGVASEKAIVVSASCAPQGGISVDDAVEIVGKVRESVHGLSGSVIVERCPVEAKAAFDVWDSVGENIDIMRRMKEQYDPSGVLNPGRFVGGI